MPLPAYLQERDYQNINYLLNPVQDWSEVDTRAAERSLTGGGFSGARRKRMRDSEQIGRYQLGNSMLTPYLAREHSAQMQTQAEAAAAARQLEQNNAELNRLQLQLQNADQRQAQEIGARMREIETSNRAQMERLQLSEQGQTSRLGIQEQGASNRQITGINANAAAAAQDYAYRTNLQNDNLNATRELAQMRESGEQNRFNSALQASQNKAFNDDDTFSAVQRLLGPNGSITNGSTRNGSIGTGTWNSGTGGVSGGGGLSYSSVSSMPVGSSQISQGFQSYGEPLVPQYSDFGSLTYDQAPRQDWWGGNTASNFEPSNWGVGYDMNVGNQSLPQGGSFSDFAGLSYDLNTGNNYGSIDDYYNF